MSVLRTRLGIPAILLCVLLTVPAGAQQDAQTFQPQIGQTGKDVVWVPTPQILVDKMLDMAQITPRDFLVDLGSGDGITVITAARRGTRALGIEYDPRMVALAKRNAEAARVGSLASFRQADLFLTDFSEATVITMFLLPSINMRLRPQLLDMAPGTRIVSNTFTMEDWEADEKATVEPCERWCTALLWIVPAKVQGTWRAQQGSLVLTQTFQKIAGTLGSAPLADARLRGDRIYFTIGATQYSGRVNGNRIEGTATTGGRPTSWTATRQ